MNSDSDMLWRFMLEGLGFAIVFGLLFGVLALGHLLLTLPMRRAERARLFLDLVESAINDGRPLEETLISISESRERAVGLRFHILAAWLGMGLGLSEALARVPNYLPPQVRAMLRAGHEMGDLRKVLPACRQLLKDAAAKTQSAVPYLFMFTFFTAPIELILYAVVVPKFSEVANGFGVKLPAASFALLHGRVLLEAQFAMVLLLLIAGFFYVGGPRVARWFPIWQRFHYLLPWRRKRMQRDFSTMLGILLDSGAPEADAVKLAGECVANNVFRRRSLRVIALLSEGVKLPEAIAAMDETGEFGWRLRNAFYARTKFLRALAGWHEWLEAKAFQQEQAAATGITTGLVLWNGIFVGAIVVSVFLFLISIIDAEVLW